jgi:hypothetical protein
MNFDYRFQACLADRSNFGDLFRLIGFEQMIKDTIAAPFADVNSDAFPISGSQTPRGGGGRNHRGSL